MNKVMNKVITVKSCSECPFFAQTGGALLAALIAKPGKERLYGVCDAPSESGLRHHPVSAIGPGAALNRDRLERRLKIRDGTTLPEACPLRTQDVLVTLGS